MSSADMQSEAARNRLLRRADWRFLLPDPRPARSVCFATGRLRCAVERISEALIVDDGVPASDCDLAVAVNPSCATLRRAWAMLRPGGACYIEQYLPRSGGARALRRQLEANGFEAVTCYWPWPWPYTARTQLWFPLDAPGALRFFLGHRPAESGIPSRLAHIIRRTIWLLSLGLRATLPVCAVAHKPSAGDSFLSDLCALCGSSDVQSAEKQAQRPSRDRMPDGELLTTIRTNWETWGLGRSPDQLSWLVLTGGRRSINKVVGLVFSEPDARPRLAIKLARVPEATAALAHEAATLRAVEASRPQLGGVPRVLFCNEYGGTLALGETTVIGLPIFTQLRQDTYRELAIKATDWQLALAGRPALQRRARWWDRLVAPVLADFSASFGAVVDPDKLRATRECLQTLGNLPMVCEQRDFGPWNVLVTADDEPGVLDWESAELQGLPALDLIYFLTYLAFFFDGAIASGRFRESYRVALDSDSLTGSVMHECLARYTQQLGIDPAALGPLRLLVWLLHSRSEYRRLVADIGGQPGSDTLRGSLFVSLWEEELRHRTAS